MTAPKIDTQAPERPATSRDAVEIMAEILEAASNGWDGKPAPAPEPLVTTPTCGTARRIAATLRALLAERDLYAAREAAAWIAGRDAAADYLEPSNSPYDWTEYAQDAHEHAVAVRRLPIPKDPAVALDRLIAERVREARNTAWDEAADIMDGYGQHGYAEEFRARICAARGSKEGRDG